jgi:hypothetical protein
MRSKSDVVGTYESLAHSLESINEATAAPRSHEEIGAG